MIFVSAPTKSEIICKPVERFRESGNVFQSHQHFTVMTQKYLAEVSINPAGSAHKSLGTHF
jgi:hypothetical protein